MASTLIVDQLQKTGGSTTALTLPTSNASASEFLQNDGAGALSWASADAGFIKYTVYTGGHSWDKTDNNPTKIIVEVQGGGGSSGSGDVDWSFGGSGGSGGYVRKFIDVSSISTATIVVGSGGVKNAGTSAGNSSWIDGTNTLTGGLGGNGANGVHPSPEHGAGGTGGTATGGDINIPGANGAYGQVDQLANCTTPSFFSSGSGTGFQRTALSYGAAIAGTAYGSGAGQGRGNNATIDGANGADGVVIVWEFK